MASQQEENPTRIPFLLPLIVGITNPDPNSNSETQERVVIINPIAQTLMVLESMLTGVAEGGKGGQPPAAKSAVEAMPRVEIKEGEEEVVGECVICLEEYKVGTTMKKMPCQHGFHEKCIEKWLGLHGSCPVCRYVMPVEDGDDVDKKGGSSDDVEERERDRENRATMELWISVEFGGRRIRRTSDDQDDDDDDDDDGMDE